MKAEVATGLSGGRGAGMASFGDAEMRVAWTRHCGGTTRPPEISPLLHALEQASGMLKGLGHCH